VALITGAGSGIGRATAIGFAAHGGKVAVADVNGENATKVASDIIIRGGSAIAIEADLDGWLTEYHEARVHQGRWCYGRTPMQTFLDTIPLAKEKLAVLALTSWTVARSVLLIIQDLTPTYLVRSGTAYLRLRRGPRNL
jgi:NAD(P)-dependent dehydrogenase (short-subunit alcohol dehydrogenase family)